MELPFTVIMDVCQPKTARTVSKEDERVLEEPLKEYQEWGVTKTKTLENKDLRPVLVFEITKTKTT